MRDTRILESRSMAGRFRGGVLAPVMAVAFMPGEGGMLSQSVTIELDPVAGRLITPVTGQMFSVYVPAQAMNGLMNPTNVNATLTELMKRRLANNELIFGLENEGELSKRMGIMPISVGGVMKVGQVAKLAHNCAVNFLRKRVYTYAAQLTSANSVVTPALLSSTVLTRFNAVLNPDDHINGMVSLTLDAADIPIKGIGVDAAQTGSTGNFGLRETGASAPRTTPSWGDAYDSGTKAGEARFVIEQDAANPGYPNVRAELDGALNGTFSLADLANAQTMDTLTRKMRAMIDANPIDGEEQVLRWCYNLSVDTGDNCFLLHSSEVIFGQDLLKATDALGIEGEVTQSRLAQRISFTVPVPRVECGGVVVTFLSVKPDEVLFQQPHPLLTKEWKGINYAAEELQVDPVAVLAREVQAGVASADETNVVFYTGYNELRRTYVNYGWNRQVDPATVDAKNAMWLYEIPASVTPDNVIYPPNIPQYPFLDQDAEIARYQITSVLSGVSPITIGPSPVETVAIIETSDLFKEFDA